MGMSANGTYIHLSKTYSNKVLVFKITASGYEFFQNIATSQYAFSVSSSSDGKYLFLGFGSGTFEILKLEG